jgi:hypothetical protein
MGEIENEGSEQLDLAASGDAPTDPAGQIRVSRATMIGARVSALAGMAMASLAVSTVMDHTIATTSSMR